MPGGSTGQQFRPHQHLKRGGDFARIKAEGHRLTMPMFILNWQPRQNAEFSRLGVVTSKRLGGAVDRNRARRLLRESFRHVQGEIASPVDLVLVARVAIQRQSFQAVVQSLRTALRRAQLWVAPGSPLSSGGAE